MSYCQFTPPPMLSLTPAGKLIRSLHGTARQLSPLMHDWIVEWRNGRTERAAAGLRDGQTSVFGFYSFLSPVGGTVG